MLMNFYCTTTASKHGNRRLHPNPKKNAGSPYLSVYVSQM